MAYLNFSDALMEAKRRAQLQGRPISQQEVTGISEGFARSAAEKNIQEESLTESKRQFTESLAQRKYESEKQIQVAEEARKREQTQTAITETIKGGFVTGAVSYLTGGYTFAGNVCIIISSCTSPDSYEVNIAREYRDKFMNFEVLTGYYSLCIYIVPLIQKYPLFKRVIKKILVDRLVDYGECCLGYKEKRKYLTSYLVKASFLGLCRIIGKGVNRFLEVQSA